MQERAVAESVRAVQVLPRGGRGLGRLTPGRGSGSDAGCVRLVLGLRTSSRTALCLPALYLYALRAAAPSNSLSPLFLPLIVPGPPSPPTSSLPVFLLPVHLPLLGF